MPFHTAKLTCHPDSPSQSVSGIEVGVCWTDGGTLALEYLLKGDLSRLRIPQLRPPRRADGLWQHTCFEAFLSAQGAAAYYEFNLSPSGEWAAYRFKSYRDGEPIEDERLAPEMSLRVGSGELALDGVIRLELLEGIRPGSVLTMGLSAVIEGIDGVLSYWALKHPPGKPDFHHPGNFLLELEYPVDGAGAIAYTDKT